jgi:hypothetical protein
MKKLNLLIVSILVIAAANAQLPNYVPTNGVIGFWPFTGNANDASGNGHNGIVNGAVLDADRNGIANECYNFSNASINLLSLPYQLNRNYTFSFWVKSLSVANSQVFIEMNSNASCNLSPQLAQYSNKMFLGTCGTFNNAIDIDLSANLLNNWSHIIWTFDSLTNTSKIYKNGTFIAQGTHSWPLSTTTDITLGVDHNTNITSYASTKFDEIGVWNRVLELSEINALYLSKATAIKTEQIISQIQITPNPSNGFVNIQCNNKLEGTLFLIKNMQGQIVMSGKLKNNKEIDCSALSNGFYLLSIGEKNACHAKFIKN